MEMNAIIERLCRQVPRAIGAILCDYEGEAIACALGAAPAPDEAQLRAKEHVPKAIELTMPVNEFLIRLAGAEPCGLIRSFGQTAQKSGAGDLASLEIRYREVEMLVESLPNECYLVLVLRRPVITAEARRIMSEASRLLSSQVS